MLKEDVAKICHNANKALCEINGDDSQVDWEQATDWQKQSAIAGVEYRIQNPDSTPADQHNAWCNDKYAAGWAYGPVKDADKKEHPCLVHYDELPAFQQSKDYLFRAIVDSMNPFIVTSQPETSAAQQA